MNRIYDKFGLKILYRQQTHDALTFTDVYVFRYKWIEGHLVDDFYWIFESEF